MAVGEGGWLHGGEAALVETRVADGGADGRGGDGCAGKGERAADLEAAAAVLRVGTARASLGRAARASILMVVVVVGGWWVV